MIYGVLVLWGVGYAWWLQRSALGRRLVRMERVSPVGDNFKVFDNIVVLDPVLVVYL